MKVEDLIPRVRNIVEELTILKQGISESYDGYAKKQLGYEDTSVEKEIQDLLTQQKNFDRKFQEKEAQFQVMGGKTRKQTLQEYTLLLFFTSYFVFSLSLAIWTSVREGWAKGAQLFGIMIVILVPVCGLMLKFL
jgi:hypothetical protein